ncbi:MAG: GGDEF domain-containing protein, partial [Solirubrobacteraceae bacterium]
MLASVQIPAELLRARRTAASARGSMALAGILICALEPAAARLPAAAIAGFVILAASAALQMLTPTTMWLKLDESVAPVSSVLIIGLGSEHVNVIALLWLGAVASGVLARGGRIFWVGRALLLASLALPIIHEQRLTFAYACMCLATITLLLTCGRVTQELRALLDRARHDADHDGLTGALSRAAFRARLDRVTAEASADDPAALILLDLDNFGAINK